MKKIILLLTVLAFHNSSFGKIFEGEGYILPKKDYCPETGYEFIGSGVKACLKYKPINGRFHRVEYVEFAKFEGRIDVEDSGRKVLTASKISTLEPEKVCGFLSDESEDNMTHGEEKTYYFDAFWGPADDECSSSEKERECSSEDHEKGRIMRSRLMKNELWRKITTSMENSLNKVVCFKGFVGGSSLDENVVFVPWSTPEEKK